MSEMEIRTTRRSFLIGTGVTLAAATFPARQSYASPEDPEESAQENLPVKEEGKENAQSTTSTEEQIETPNRQSKTSMDSYASSDSIIERFLGGWLALPAKEDPIKASLRMGVISSLAGTTSLFAQRVNDRLDRTLFHRMETLWSVEDRPSDSFNLNYNYFKNHLKETRFRSVMEVAYLSLCSSIIKQSRSTARNISKAGLVAGTGYAIYKIYLFKREHGDRRALPIPIEDFFKGALLWLSIRTGGFIGGLLSSAAIRISREINKKIKGDLDRSEMR